MCLANATASKKPGLVNSHKKLLKMVIYFVDFPIKHGDFPVRYVKLPEGIPEDVVIL